MSVSVSQQILLAVYFLYDSGCPKTTVPEDVLRLFGIQKWDMLNVPIKVNGVVMSLLVTQMRKWWGGTFWARTSWSVIQQSL